MVFKRVDRYIGGSFLAYLAGALLVIGALFVTSDFVSKLEDVGEIGVRTAASRLTAYYAYVVPLFLLDAVPALVLVAAGMVMVRVARSRELLALKASGVSVRRAMSPILWWAVVLSVGVFAARETLGPELARRSGLLRRTVSDRDEDRILLSDRDFKLFINRYDFTQDTMQGVTLVQFWPSGMPRRVMRAAAGAWLADGSLGLEKVEVEQFDAQGRRLPVERWPSKRVETRLTVQDVLVASYKDKEPGIMYNTLGQLVRLMRQYPALPYFKVTFNARLASFFDPLVLLLVGVPWVVGFEQSIQSRFIGVVVCIAVAAAHYALGFVLTSMGTAGVVPAAVAGWLPTWLLGGLGVVLFLSMAT